MCQGMFSSTLQSAMQLAIAVFAFILEDLNNWVAFAFILGSRKNCYFSIVKSFDV